LTSAEYLIKAIFNKNTVSNYVTIGITALIISIYLRKNKNVKKTLMKIFFLHQVSCTLINCYSVKLASRINSVFGLGKIAALVLITGFGIYYLAIGKIILSKIVLESIRS